MNVYILFSSAFECKGVKWEFEKNFSSQLCLYDGFMKKVFVSCVNNWFLYAFLLFVVINKNLEYEVQLMENIGKMSEVFNRKPLLTCLIAKYLKSFLLTAHCLSSLSILILSTILKNACGEIWNFLKFVILSMIFFQKKFLCWHCRLIQFLFL
jgi:hypothetical protein